MEKFTVADWQSDLLEYFAEDMEMHAPKGDDEFTAQELAELLEKEGTTITVKTAHAWMAKAIKEGRASMRKWLGDGGAETNLYKWVGDDSGK